MSTLVITTTRPQMLLFQFLAQASRGRSVFSWRRQKRLVTGRATAKRERFEVVNEFRAKLRQAEDLIGKLGYSLREMQDVPGEATAAEPKVPTSASIAQLFRRK